MTMDEFRPFVRHLLRASGRERDANDREGKHLLHMMDLNASRKFFLFRIQVPISFVFTFNEPCTFLYLLQLFALLQNRLTPALRQCPSPKIAFSKQLKDLDCQVLKNSSVCRNQH